MADLLQEMSQRLHAGGNIFSDDLVAGDRCGADQQTVERARDPKIIRREILAGFLSLPSSRRQSGERTVGLTLYLDSWICELYRVFY